MILSTEGLTAAEIANLEATEHALNGLTLDDLDSVIAYLERKVDILLGDPDYTQEHGYDAIHAVNDEMKIATAIYDAKRG